MAMTAGEVTFELDRFELVATTGSATLLRLSGSWVCDVERRLPAPSVFVELPGVQRRLPPLPPAAAQVTAGPDGPPWQLAFAAPVELFEAGVATFSLEIPDVGSFELPAPLDNVPRLRELSNRTSSTTGRTEDQGPPAGDTRRRAKDVEAELSELQRALEAAREQAVTAATERQRLSDELARVNSARQEQQHDAEKARARAETRARDALQQARSENAASRAELAQTLARVEALEVTHARAVAERDAASAAKVELAAQSERDRAELEAAIAEEKELTAHNRDLERQVEELTAISERAREEAALARRAWADSEAARQAERPV